MAPPNIVEKLMIHEFLLCFKNQSFVIAQDGNGSPKGAILLQKKGGRFANLKPDDAKLCVSPRFLSTFPQLSNI